MSASRKPLALVLLVVLVAERSFGVSSGNRELDILCVENEKQALLSFKQGLADASNRLSSWVNGEGQDCCRWARIVCDNITGHVKELHLGSPDGTSYSNRLKGKITPSLLNLKHLTYLDLSYNDFGGTQIPSFMGSLVSLRYLNLTEAGFEGKIPHQLGNLSSLSHLGLRAFYGSQLYVDSLHWLSGLSSLVYLDMSYVNLSKASDWLLSVNKLPSLLELYLSSSELNHIHALPHVNFTSLTVLDISENFFIAFPIPDWIFSLSKLIHLDLSRSDFSGPFPNGSCSLPWLSTLDVSFSFLNSTIPDCLYSLSSLEHLDLRSNGLQGVISSAIGNLTSLSYFDLSFNALEGNIPASMGNLCNMESILLESNKFGGKISEAFESLLGCIPNKLKALYLGWNAFTGPITDTVGEFKNLVSLHLRENLLSGPIPVSLGKLSALRYLDIGWNRLNGSLPRLIGSLSNLEDLDFSNNLLEGVVSEVHFANLTSLTKLYASGNSLILRVSPDWIPPFHLMALGLKSWVLGPQFPMWLRSQRGFRDMDLSQTRIADAMPSWFWNLWNLSASFAYLNLSHNQITGEIPDMPIFTDYSMIYLGSNKFKGTLPRMSSNVTELDLSNNSFSGGISHFLCHSTGTLNKLKILHLGENLLSGNIPDCWMYWPSLEVIKLDDNSLTGEIPSSMGSLNNLQSLHLRNNGLSGEIPLSLRNCTMLQVIDLGLNKLVGRIPTWVGAELSNLMSLGLRRNQLSGPIPIEICHLAHLQILDVAHNNLFGSIPRCFNNLTAMLTKPDLRYLIFYSTYEDEFLENAFVVTRGREDQYNTILTLVASLDLSNNKLSGEFPEELTSLHGLLSLNLSGNCLRGKIPDKIGGLTWAQSLDFSRNQLTGNIPRRVSNLSFLSFFNVSYNNLSGEIPLSTQLQRMEASNFIGNQLCGPPLPKRCREDPNNATPVGTEDEGGRKEGGGHEEEYWFHLGLAVGFGVGFLGFISPLLFYGFYRRAYFWFFEEYLWSKVLNCYIKFKYTLLRND